MAFMPRGPTKGRAPVERVEVRVPTGVYSDFDRIVGLERRWKSVADFLLEAGKHEVERWKSAGHRLPEGPSPADLVEEVRARREAEGPGRRRAL